MAAQPIYPFPELPPEPITYRAILTAAYERPCFICERTGVCHHREPQVELALSGGARKSEGAR